MAICIPTHFLRDLAFLTAALIACFTIGTERPATAQTIETPGAMPLKAAWLPGGPYGIEYVEVPIGSTVTGELADTRYPSTGYVVARIKGRPGQRLRIIVEDHGYPMALAVYRDRASGDKGNAFTQQPQKGPIDALFALPPSGVVYAYYYGVSEKNGLFGKKRLTKGRYGFRIVDADAPTAAPAERIVAVAPPSETGAAVQQTSAAPTSPTASPIREGASAILSGQSTFQEYPAGKTVKFTRHVEAGQGLDVWIRPKGAPYISIDMCMKSPSGARTCTVRNAWARPPYVHLDYIAPVSGPVEFTIKTSNFDAKSYTLYVAPLAINRTAMLAALHAYDGVVWQTNDEERNGVKMNVFETHSATPDGLKMVNEYANGEAFFVEFRVAPDGRTWIVAPNQPKIPVRLTTAGQDGTLSLAFDETGGSRRGYSLYPDRSLAIFQEVQTTGANAVQLAYRGQAWGTQPKLIDPARM